MLSENLKKIRKEPVTFKVTVCKFMRDYGKEPYFVKKLEAARRDYEEYGVPEQVLTGKH